MFSASGSLTLYQDSTAEETALNTESPLHQHLAGTVHLPGFPYLRASSPLLFQHTYWANSSEIRLILIIPISSLEPTPELYFQLVAFSSFLEHPARLTSQSVLNPRSPLELSHSCKVTELL